MNNNTKIRLHLSKHLFESIAKEVLTEAKKANDGYTVAVKQPKQPKQSKDQAKAPEVQKTDKEATMGEMETKVAEEGKLKEFTGTETADSGVITVIATLLGIGVPLATMLVKDLMKAKTPEEKKQVIQKDLAGKSDKALKEYEHHYEIRNGQCRRYNDEGEYTVVSMHYCR